MEWDKRKTKEALHIKYSAFTRDIMNKDTGWHVSDMWSDVIYTFECRQCASRYVGRTSQHLIDRIKQHVPRYLLPSSKSKLRKPDREYQSAIARHLAGSEECRQAYSDADFTILARSRSSHHLQVLEATYIFTLKPALCLQKSFVTPLQIFTEKKNALSSSLHPT